MADRKYKDSSLLEVQREFHLKEKRVEVLSFLETNPFLIPLLLETYSNIQQDFPTSAILLRVDTEPEEFDTRQLVASITTDMAPDDAVDALTRFDRRWWLQAMKRSQGKLQVTLRWAKEVLSDLKSLS